MFVPSDYAVGYEKARMVDAELAARYVEHTTIGDPDADALANDLVHLGHVEGARLIAAAMDENHAALSGAP